MYDDSALKLAQNFKRMYLCLKVLNRLFCRYLAIVHPLRAREIIGMTFAKASIVCVFILCVAFNLPRFWNETIETMPCVGKFL